MNTSVSGGVAARAEEAARKQRRIRNMAFSNFSDASRKPTRLQVRFKHCFVFPGMCSQWSAHRQQTNVMTGISVWVIMAHLPAFRPSTSKAQLCAEQISGEQPGAS